MTAGWRSLGFRCGAKRCAQAQRAANGFGQVIIEDVKRGQECAPSFTLRGRSAERWRGGLCGNRTCSLHALNDRQRGGIEAALFDRRRLAVAANQAALVGAEVEL